MSIPLLLTISQMRHVSVTMSLPATMRLAACSTSARNSSYLPEFSISLLVPRFDFRYYEIAASVTPKRLATSAWLR